MQKISRLVLAILFLESCQGRILDTDYSNPGENAVLPTNKELIERVIVVGIDGAGSFHSPELTPNIVSFLRSGTYSDMALNVFPTSSGQNWGSIITGVTPDKHGVTNSNIWLPYPENSTFPTIFKLINAKFPSSEQYNVASDQHNVASDQNNVASDQNIMASDQNNLASNQNNVASDQNNVASDQNNVASDQNIMASDKNNLASDQNIVASDQTRPFSDQTMASHQVNVAAYQNSMAFDKNTSACFVAWGPIAIGLVERSLPVVNVLRRDSALVQLLTENFFPTIGGNFKFLFVQLNDVDHAGHEYGYGSPEYNAQYTITDGYVQEILNAIDMAGLASSALVVITADHGGQGQGHGGASPAESHVLWGMRGPGVVKRSFEPDMLSILDIPATILDTLGIEVPSNFDGKVIQLFE